MVMELTAARDLSRFIEKFHAKGRGRCQSAPECAILPRLRRGAKNSRVYRSRDRKESFRRLILPLGGTLQVALTSVRLIGMIRGLFCLLFT
jgi:hypothetical protein